jgi:hypothetical protein
MSELEEERRELRRKVELFHALSALKTNLNFQRLIMNGFMREEVINLTRMASKEMTAEAKIARGQQAQAAFVLEDFLSRVHNEGEDARDKMPALDQLIDQEAQEQET